MKGRTAGPIVAVIGGAEATPQESATAEAVGRELALAGATLICGGRSGVMEAACRGARIANGLTVGILPGTEPDQANPYVDLPIVTGLDSARNAIIIRSARAVIAVGGSYGTLSEIALALCFGVPVVGLGTWEIHRDGLARDPIHRASDPREAVALALSLAADR